MKKTILVLCLTAMNLVAADATGIWIGTLTKQGADAGEPAHLVLKQEGTKLTGTAGPDSGEQDAIQDGTAEDGRLVFYLLDGTMKFDLKQEGDVISGEVAVERNGQSRKARLTLKRQN